MLLLGWLSDGGGCPVDGLVRRPVRRVLGRQRPPSGATVQEPDIVSLISKSSVDIMPNSFGPSFRDTLAAFQHLAREPNEDN